MSNECSDVKAPLRCRIDHIVRFVRAVVTVKSSIVPNLRHVFHSVRDARLDRSRSANETELIRLSDSVRSVRIVLRRSNTFLTIRSSEKHRSSENSLSLRQFLRQVLRQKNCLVFSVVNLIQVCRSTEAQISLCTDQQLEASLFPSHVSKSIS